MLATHPPQRHRCRCPADWHPSALAHGLVVAQQSVPLSSDSDPACPETIKARIVNNCYARDSGSFWGQRRLF